MQTITIKIPTGLVTEVAQKRFAVSKYETHRGFKALAFYLLSRTLTTSNGLYRELDPRRKDGYQSWSSFNKSIGQHLGLSFNTVGQVAKWAQDFGFMSIVPTGYQFKSIDKIISEYALWFPSQEVTYQTLTINPKEQSLEHILKTLVFGENFAKQEFAVIRKIRKIPGVAEKLNKYIDNWEALPAKELLKRIVEWQKQTFLNYIKGTEAYDFFHSIHADIALTCKKIKDHFAFKCTRSSSYLKEVLEKLQYITVQNRELVSNATRLPHEPDGKCKPIKFVYMPSQNARKWLLPDLITLNLKNL